MAYKLTDDLLTGNAQIDSEHKELIDAINTLIEACSKGMGRTEVEKTVKFLVSYTKKHFANEEILQMRSNYPDYNNHKIQHKQFIDVIESIHKKFIENGPSIALVSEVNSKVGNWIVRHIKTEDAKVAAHIKNSCK